MEYLTERYVSFGTAKMLKKHGLDVVCGSYFITGEDKKDKSKERFNISSVMANRNNYQSELADQEYITCPSLSLAMSWLRRKYNLVVEARPYPHEDGVFYWACNIGYMDSSILGYFNKYQKAGFDTYEEAIEHAIRESEKYMNN